MEDASALFGSLAIKEVARTARWKKIFNLKKRPKVFI
jgi:hypothetical protein